MAICYALMTGGYYGDVGEGRSRGLPFMSTSLFTGNGSKWLIDCVFAVNVADDMDLQPNTTKLKS